MKIIYGLVGILIGIISFYLRYKYPQKKTTAIPTNFAFILGGIGFIILGLFEIYTFLKIRL
jgi:hypothetical protein